MNKKTKIIYILMPFIFIIILPIIVFGVHFKKKDVPCVVMRIMGGLCDQMEYYLFGKEIEKIGFSVKYDLSWYDDYPIKSGVNARNFQLKTAFPKLELHAALPEEISFYKNAFVLNRNDLTGSWSVKDKVDKPMYLDLTLSDAWACCVEAQEAIKNPENYRKYFIFDESILDKENLKILKKIKSISQTVGIHVRRGDMSISNENTYFKTPDVDYFVKSVENMKEKFPNSYFFFFSDEPDYISDVIFPDFKEKINGQIVNINDVNRCYMDLFLLSKCKHQIRSQGTMGEFAYILNKNPEKTLTAPKSCRVDLHVKPDIVF